MSVDSDAAKAGDSGWRETVKIVIHALILAVIVRIFFYQPFNIPSGSMKETLLVGDYLFVSKLSYGYSRYSFPFGIIPFSGRIFGAQPKRGDVVVFKLPRDTDKDYIKRILGLPGDEIYVRNGIVYINGTAVPRVRAGNYVGPEEDGADPALQGDPAQRRVLLRARPRARRTLRQRGPLRRAARPLLHDGRQSRQLHRQPRAAAQYDGVGFVPYENLVGRAEIIFFSAAVDDPDAFRLTSPWTWPFDIRWRRIFSLVR